MTDQTSELLPVEQPVDLRQKTNTLGEEAALFLADRSAASPWQRVIVCDFEFLYDMDAFKRYQVAEDDPTQGFVRWPFHRVVAGAWCVHGSSCRHQCRGDYRPARGGHCRRVLRPVLSVSGRQDHQLGR